MYNLLYLTWCGIDDVVFESHKAKLSGQKIVLQYKFYFTPLFIRVAMCVVFPPGM